MSTPATEALASPGYPAVPATPLPGDHHAVGNGSSIVGVAALSVDGSGLPSGRMTPLTPPHPANAGYHALHRLGGGFSRSGSTPRTPGLGGAARAGSSDNASFLAAVKRQMDTLEDKLGTQISRVQQQSDKLRDAAFARVDAKMSTMEALQPKLDRRLAELSGQVKGLSDEMQAQIRKVDQMDPRFTSWRHQLEEEIRGKFSEVDTQLQQMSSNIRVQNTAADDALKRYNKRILRLESLVEERLSLHEETSHHLETLHGRLAEIEEYHSQQVVQGAQDQLVALTGPPPPVRMDANDLSLDHHADIAELQKRLAEAFHKIEELQHDSNEMKAQMDVSLRTLRSQMETKDEHLRSLNDHVKRADWDGRFKSLEKKQADLDHHRIEHSMKLDDAHKKLDSHEQVHDHFHDRFRRWRDHVAHGGSLTAPSLLTAEASACGEDPERGSERGASATPSTALVAAAVQQGTAAFAAELRDCSLRVHEVECRCSALDSKLDATSHSDLEPRVERLVEQLRDVCALAPKVLENEEHIREVAEKMGRLEVMMRMDPSGTSGASRR